MKTAVSINNSITWYSNSGQKKVVASYNISDVLQSLEPSFLKQYSQLEVAEDGKIRTNKCPELAALLNTAKVISDLEVAASDEVYFLTQVILNTLNTEPSQFHNMFDIPGLEAERWDILANVAQYLISQGWLEAKSVEEKLLVKLTIEGKLYLRNNAWS